MGLSREIVRVVEKNRIIHVKAWKILHFHLNFSKLFSFFRLSILFLLLHDCLATHTQHRNVAQSKLDIDNREHEIFYWKLLMIKLLVQFFHHSHCCVSESTSLAVTATWPHHTHTQHNENWGEKNPHGKKYFRHSSTQCLWRSTRQPVKRVRSDDEKTKCACEQLRESSEILSLN